MERQKISTERSILEDGVKSVEKVVYQISHLTCMMGLEG